MPLERTCANCRASLYAPLLLQAELPSRLPRYFSCRLFRMFWLCGQWLCGVAKQLVSAEVASKVEQQASLYSKCW
jgi:hypothetical protein